MQMHPERLDGERHQANQPKFKPHATSTACNLDGRRARRAAAPVAQT